MTVEENAVVEKSLSESLVDVCRELDIGRDDMSRLSVKKMGEGNSMSHCHSFCRDEIDDVRARTAREKGAGVYQVICRDDKCIRRKIRFDIKSEDIPDRLSLVKEPGRHVQDAGQENRPPQGGQGRSSRRRSRNRNRGRGGNAESNRNTSAENARSHGSEISFRDLIDAEQRGYDKCKDAYELIIKQMEFHHKKEIQMIKDSKGSEQFLNDDGGDGDDVGEGDTLDRVGDIVDTLKEAGAPLIGAYAYKLQSESDIAKKNAGIEVAEGQKAGGAMPDLQTRLTSALGALVRGARDGEDPAFHVNGILSSFTTDEIRENLMISGALDELIRLYPDLGERRGWFDEVLVAVGDALDKTDSKKESEKPETKK